MRPVLAVVAVVAVLALTACGESSSVRPGGQPSGGTHSYAADGVVLQVSYGGGLVPPDSTRELPYWTLYGDGRVITRGAEPAIYPGAALPSVLVGQAKAGAVDEVAAAARAAGVDGVKRDYGDPPVADASTTTIRLSDESGTHTVQVYALQEGGDIGNEPREKLRRFLDRLTGEGGGLAGVTDEKPYVPTALAVVAAQPYRAPGDVQENVQAWEGPALAPGYDLGAAGTCTVVSGDALAGVLPSVRKATAITRWQHDGADWRLTFRPLLPDERTCEDAFGD